MPAGDAQPSPPVNHCIEPPTMGEIRVTAPSSRTTDVNSNDRKPSNHLADELADDSAKGLSSKDRVLPAKELSSKELSSKELSFKELPAKEISSKDRVLPARELSSKDFSTTDLPAKEVSPTRERRLKSPPHKTNDIKISPSSISNEDTRDEVIKEVVMSKGSVGLGFCIEGGKGSPLGDRPIAVKRLFKGACKKGSFYIAQYPVRWTAQSTLTFALPDRPVHSDTVLGFSGKHSNHAAITRND